MERIIIFGMGPVAQLANYYFDIDSNYEVAAFTVDKEYIKAETFEGKPVIAIDEVKGKYPPDKYNAFVALSYTKLNKVRQEKFHKLKELGYKLVSYVSSRCSYLSQYPPGENCFILEDNTIQPFVRIGKNVTLWSGNHIGHHSVIKDHNFISSHVVISGHCEVKENCFIGVNATLHNDVIIEKENLIAAGAVISKSTKDGEVYVPAKSSVLNKKSKDLNF